MKPLTPTPAALAKLRREIEEARAHLDRVTAITRNRSELVADVRNLCAAWEETGRDAIAYRMTGATTGGKLHDLLRVSPLGFAGVGLGPLLAAVLGADVLADRLCLLAPAVLDVPDAPERAAMVDGLAAELLDLELAEEEMLGKLETAGYAVERRPDADPRAVLALPS